MIHRIGKQHNWDRHRHIRNKTSGRKLYKHFTIFFWGNIHWSSGYDVPLNKSIANQRVFQKQTVQVNFCFKNNSACQHQNFKILQEEKQ